MMPDVVEIPFSSLPSTVLVVDVLESIDRAMHLSMPTEGYPSHILA
jgi:hypothetical protein